MSDSSASANLLDKDNEDESPASSSTKDNNSTLVDASGDEDSSWRKHSNTSSSPDLLVTGKSDGVIQALGNDASSDEDEGATEEEVPTEAQVIQKAKSVRSTHKKVVEVEIEEEEPLLAKKTRSRFRWSHSADSIVENANTKDEAYIRLLLAKEPWNAGHGRVMKAWQDLTRIILDTVVDGDKIFQGVSEVTLKKRYQLYLDLGKKWGTEKEKRNQPENEEDKHDVNCSTATLICGGIEDLWEEFVMRKETRKKKRKKSLRRKQLQKMVLKKFASLQWESCESATSRERRKRRVHLQRNQHQKKKISRVMCKCKTSKHWPIEAHPQCLVVPALILWIVSHRVAMSEEHQKKGWNLKKTN